MTPRERLTRIAVVFTTLLLPIAAFLPIAMATFLLVAVATRAAAQTASDSVPARTASDSTPAKAASDSVPAQTTSDSTAAQTASDSTPEPPGYAPEPPAITKGLDWFNAKVNLNQSGGPHDGFYPEFGNMVTGAGWISGGPGYRHQLWDGRARFDVSASVSWRLYRAVQGRFELPRLANDHLTIGAQAMYQDLQQVNFFGVGNDSLKANRSGYRLNDTDIFGYAAVRPGPDWLSMNGRFGWIHQPTLSTMTGWSVSYPNTLRIFTDDTAPGLTQPSSFWHGDASIEVDTRDHTGHPTRGGLYRGTFARYTDRTYGKYSFERYEIEGAQYIPVVENNWVIGLHGWGVFSQTSGGNSVPFYLMPSLGGGNTLRGYIDYRFHDRDMEVFNVESRWGLWTHLDAAVFFDTGKVAPRAGDLDFNHMKRSYGFGFRVHNRQSTIVRMDIGHSVEGWRIFIKLHDPFHRETMSGGRASVIPFVP
jgi:hypothetical protein